MALLTYSIRPCVVSGTHMKQRLFLFVRVRKSHLQVLSKHCISPVSSWTLLQRY